MVTSTRSTTMHGSPAPRRALIVSADIGAGHNSAGRALEEAMGRARPGCQVRWLDTLATVGPGFGPLARAFYVSQVRHTPGMYEFFFSAMGGHRWYLESVRRGFGAWFGRRMGPRIRALAAEALSLAVMTGGIIALAHRAPQVARDGATAGRAGQGGKKNRSTICLCRAGLRERTCGRRRT